MIVFLKSKPRTFDEAERWVKKNTDFIPEEFTQDQTDVALGNVYDLLERFGAIEITGDKLTWIG